MATVEQIPVTRDDVDAALADADMPVLLMVLVHLTGERKWIEEPFLPKRDIAFFADESGGLSDDAQQEVRDAASQAVLAFHEGRLDIPAEPPEALYNEMMSVCVGEEVPEEYLLMLLEEMGLRSRDPEWSKQPDPSELAGLSVLIVGAGVCGICVAAKLEAAGVDYRIVEKNDRLGGTWYENRYPEVAVDVPNHFYSFSFRPNPELVGVLLGRRGDRGLSGELCRGVRHRRADSVRHRGHACELGQRAQRVARRARARRRLD